MHTMVAVHTCINRIR